MSIALMAVIFLLALTGMSVVHYSIFLGILVCLISGVMIVLYAVLLRKAPKVLKNSLMWGSVVVCLLLFALMKPQKPSASITGYTKELLKVEDMINNGNKKAEKKLEKLSEKYGETDSILGLYSYLCLENEDVEGAYEYMARTSNHSSREYYQRMEYLYLVDGSRNTTDTLYNMYEEAANLHTDWEYIQRMAGVAKFEQGKYDSAEYYLISAITLDDKDAMAYYYLGALSYEKGNYDDCTGYFYQALKNGVSDEVKSWIAWYLERMGVE